MDVQPSTAQLRPVIPDLDRLTKGDVVLPLGLSLTLCQRLLLSVHAPPFHLLDVCVRRCHAQRGERVCWRWTIMG